MLTIRNNNISLSRGETGTYTYTGIKKNGEPFILPVANDLNETLEKRNTYAILAFTVKTAAYGETVIEKYFDLEDSPMYNGKSDMSKGGYHKFISQIIEETTEPSVIRSNPGKVYKLIDGEKFTYATAIRLENGTLGIVEYSFVVNIPIEYEDTDKLEPKEYTYDLNLYFGELTPEEIASLRGISYEYVNGFPLKRVVAKIPLLTPHKFILGDSNNV